MKRKEFIKLGTSALAFSSTFGLLASYYPNGNLKGSDLFFKISLAEWSLHNNLFDGEIDHLDFPATAKNEFGISAVEYVNQFFKDKAEDTGYLDELNSRCKDLGIDQVLIMIDGEGGLAVNDDSERTKAIENHYKWVEAAEYLDCHSIRVNARGDGTRSEQKKAAVDGLGRLATFAKDYNINVIVENHGGYSSNGEWLTDVMKQVDMENCGTLPDFGNFTISEDNVYNRYKDVEQMMPYAKGVSAKTMSFDEEGNEKTIDYNRMLNIVKEAGYTGYVGIEYSGEISEFKGIHLTKSLLEKVGHEISS